jgi:predicted dehydrogenase/nucleoside-diphosphate-sugar epimerase/GT2 family glycosyltransferase
LLSDRPVRVGLLGAGYIATAHARALSRLETVELAAVCDLSLPRARALADAFDIPICCGSMDELLVVGCDVVHVLVPPDRHAPLCRQLLDAGIDVFVEKPMALDPAECRELVALAAARRCRLGVNHNFLFLPAYERLRQRLEGRSVGTLDHVALNWLYTLRLLQFGPYNNWILAAPPNLFFEVGSHLAAFAVDLFGPPDIVTATASWPCLLPGNQTVYRHWNATLIAGRVSASLNLSVAPGETDRSVLVRGLGESVRVDFERDSCIVEKSRSTSTLFDNVTIGLRSASQELGGSLRNFHRHLLATLTRRAAGNPFEDSIARSIAAFYRTRRGPCLDRRLDGAFGADVIDVCARIVSGADARALAPALARSATRSASIEARAASKVLVVGGTGFIGKRLVRRLLAQGHPVRVMSRSLAAARIEFSDDDVELVEGHHGDHRALDRALEGIDVVCHLAKAVGDTWAEYLTADVEPTRALGEASVRHRIRRLIYVGTIDSYDSARRGAVIDCSTPVDSAIERRNHYARSKAWCERVLQSLAREQGLPLVILRPGIVIGAGSPPAHWGVGMFLSDTRVDYWGEGANKLPFVLVEDVADAIARAVDRGGLDGETLLITGPPLLSAREYVKEVEERSGTAILGSAKPIWEFFVLDLFNQSVKHLIRHPKRRTPSLHDWSCRAHLSTYDSSGSRAKLDWAPTEDRDRLVAEGIHAAVDHYFGAATPPAPARDTGAKHDPAQLLLQLGVVVIGRNEGIRLRQCLSSLRRYPCPVVYVDSGSVDDSPAVAAFHGAQVVHLDPARPFTAARARNEGLEALVRDRPELRFVQFVDGDCEVVPGWFEEGLAFLARNPRVGAVCGRRREREPGASIYNYLCEVEWNTQVGRTKATGGDVMLRIDALVSVGGWRGSLIAGEEPELCVRLRAANWDIWRLDAHMTLHDAAMRRFHQWWRRTLRAGHAYAEGAHLHGDVPEMHYVRESRRGIVWGFLLPVLALTLYGVFGPVGLIVLLAYALQLVRLMIRESGSPGRRFGAALLGVLGKFPEFFGQVRFHWNRLAGRASEIIEYK